MSLSEGQKIDPFQAFAARERQPEVLEPVSERFTRDRDPDLRLGALIAMSLCLGALESLAGAGSRGFHFLPSFIIGSVFVLGIGLLINHIAGQLRSR
jgi:hypothetical protein